jgi:hypothetical protein
LLKGAKLLGRLEGARLLKGAKLLGRLERGEVGRPGRSDRTAHRPAWEASPTVPRLSLPAKSSLKN